MHLWRVNKYFCCTRTANNSPSYSTNVSMASPNNHSLPTHNFFSCNISAIWLHNSFMVHVGGKWQWNKIAERKFSSHAHDFPIKLRCLFVQERKSIKFSSNLVSGDPLGEWMWEMAHVTKSLSSWIIYMHSAKSVCLRMLLFYCTKTRGHMPCSNGKVNQRT